MCWVNAKGKENGGRKYKQGSEAIPKEHASKDTHNILKNLRHNKISIYFLQHSIVMFWV